MVWNTTVGLIICFINIHICYGNTTQKNADQTTAKTYETEYKIAIALAISFASLLVITGVLSIICTCCVLKRKLGPGLVYPANDNSTADTSAVVSETPTTKQNGAKNYATPTKEQNAVPHNQNTEQTWPRQMIPIHDESGHEIVAVNNQSSGFSQQSNSANQSNLETGISKSCSSTEVVGIGKRHKRIRKHDTATDDYVTSDQTPLGHKDNLMENTIPKHTMQQIQDNVIVAKNATEQPITSQARSTVEYVVETRPTKKKKKKRKCYEDKTIRNYETISSENDTNSKQTPLENKTDLIDKSYGRDEMQHREPSLSDGNDAMLQITSPDKSTADSLTETHKVEKKKKKKHKKHKHEQKSDNDIHVYDNENDNSNTFRL